MSTNNEFISDFLDTDTITALSEFIANADSFQSAADKIAIAFGSTNNFSSMNDQDVQKLLVSFKHNLTLLIQKTWVEKSDIALKDQLLYQLDQLLKAENSSWVSNYTLFRQIIDQAVFLMFGQATDSVEFAEYTIRIDPEFGIFWWYISNLPPKTEWTEDKCRISMMLGMYFLANY